MPDDDQQSQGTNEPSDFDAGYTDEGSAPDFAPDHDSDRKQPRPDQQQQDQIVSPKQMRDNMQAFQSGLNSVLTQQRANQGDHFQMMRELQAIQEEANKPPPKPPVPYAMPAPPDQGAKNDIAVLATNVLKWGALIGLAYGVTRRSPIRGAMFKAALGAGLQSYYEGDNHGRNKAVSLWEKNRQVISEANKQQQAQYQDTLKNRKTTFQQKMDILKAQAQVWRNDRMQDAAISANMMKVEQTYKDMVRMQNDWEKQTRRDREQWYKHLGLSGKEGVSYRDWVISKGGPDPAGKSADDLNKIEKDYPYHQMIDEYDKRKTQEEDDRKFELHKREKDYDAKIKKDSSGGEDSSGGTSDNPLGLNLGQ